MTENGTLRTGGGWRVRVGRNMGRLLVVALVVAGLVAASREAGAQGTGARQSAAARAHYDRGLRQYEVGNYEKALEEFRAAHVLKPDPAFIFNAAQCLRRLGKSSDALLLYRRYLGLDPASPNRAEVEKRIRELESQEAATPVAPPARVEPAAPEPAPMAPAAAASTLPVPPPSLESRPVASLDQRAPAEAEGGGVSWRSWAGVALTAALAGGAVLSGLTARSRYDHLKTTCGATTAGCETTDIDGVGRRALWTNVLIAAAGVSAVATGVMFYIDSRTVGASLAHAF